MVFCYSISGYYGNIVAVEVDIRGGLPGMDIIGLPGSEIRESRERIRVAIRNSGFTYPGGRITVNLAPADVPKNGTAFDLAIATAILQSSGQLTPQFPPSALVLGELKLSGSVDPVRGVISAIDEARKMHIDHFLVPGENRKEAAALELGKMAAIHHLSELGSEQFRFRPISGGGTASLLKLSKKPGFGDYRMDDETYRALQISAAGGHHTIFMGPPGLGKTMAARRIPSLLSPLSASESVEVTRVYSIADLRSSADGLIRERPVRVPHHSATLEGMIGGGRHVTPGEISLAHGGVLILDEATEFKPRILQSLREPLELSEVHISRATKKYRFPADFQLLLTVNKCPCGNYSSKTDPCLCSRAEIFQYWKRFGAALMDRVDVRIDLLQDVERRLYTSEELTRMSQRVAKAIALQRERYRSRDYRWNSRIPASDMPLFCILSEGDEAFLEEVSRKRRLTLRGQYAVRRIARTIADLRESRTIAQEDLQHAIALRAAGEFSGFL